MLSIASILLKQPGISDAGAVRLLARVASGRLPDGVGPQEAVERGLAARAAGAAPGGRI